MSQSEKVVRGAFPNAQSELDRILDETILPELESFEKSMPGSGLISKLFAALLTFFREIKNDRTADGIKSSLNTLGLAFLYDYDELNTEPLSNPTIAQLLQMAVKLAEANAEIQSLKDERFATQAALEQREKDVTRLKGQVEHLGNLLIQARQSELQQEERLLIRVQPVLDIGERQMQQLRQIQAALDTFTTPLATAITQLSGVLSGERASAAAPQPQKTQTAAPEFDPLPEIERHQNWLAEAHELMEELGDQRTDLINSLAAVGDLIKYLEADSDNRDQLQKDLARVNSRIAKLLSMREGVTVRLRGLTAYQKAVDMVKEGVSNDLFKSELPDLAAESTEPEPTPTPALDTVSENVGEPAERRSQLEALAKNFQLTVYGVYIISLYYCIPSNERRAAASVVSAGEKAGLGKAFGLPKSSTITKTWRTPQDEEAKFLQYKGRFAGGMYAIQPKPLSWNPRQIFTEEEIKKFIKFVTADK